MPFAILVHPYWPIQDERDNFDMIADYIFQASWKLEIKNIKRSLIL